MFFTYFFDEDQRIDEFDDNDYTITHVIDTNKAKNFTYTYDFGDDWVHEEKRE